MLAADLAGRDLADPESAAQLFPGDLTIKTHVSRIFAKTAFRDRAAAIGYAYRRRTAEGPCRWPARPAGHVAALTGW